MTSRRGLLGWIAAAPWIASAEAQTRRPAPASPAPAAPAAVPPDLRFQVFRRGSPIGFHTTQFVAQGPRLLVRTRLELGVSIAFVRVFRYLHQAEEAWRDGRLETLAATTDDDGTPYAVRAAAAGGAIRIDGPQGVLSAPPEAFTSNAIWNMAFLRARSVIDCEKGRHVPLAVETLGNDTVGDVPAQKFRLTLPYLTGDIWYDASGRWLGAEMRTGREALTYQPA